MVILIYQITVPEYKLKKFRLKGKKIEYMGTPWYKIKIPKIYMDNKPDFELFGQKIDKCLLKHFLGKKVVIRAVSVSQHKGKSISDMIKIIKKIGHDKYDPNIKGDRYENIENKKIDFFALPFTIKKDGEYFKHFVEPFYFWPVSQGGDPQRIDIAIIYDRSKLKNVPHRYKGRENELKKDGFVFRDQGNKKDAILGIIKVL